VDTLELIGTATCLVRLGPFVVLTDPNFLHRGQRAYLGKGLWSRRLTEPTRQASDLPDLDAVVLSHLHGDHFDRVARRDLSRDQPVLTTQHAARRLDAWGFETHGLGTWDSEELVRDGHTLLVRALPAVHARGVLGALLPPVMGTMLELRHRGAVVRRVYVSGDTLTGDHITAIADRYPEIDVAVVHLGGTRVLLDTVTMDTTQAVDFLRRVRPAQALGVHYDDYKVFKDPCEHWASQAREAGVCSDVRRVARGEAVVLGPRPGP
jgi:L-ascorbate metabolism protein UlaG (beta-lactamase superfamily)